MKVLVDARLVNKLPEDSLMIASVCHEEAVMPRNWAYYHS